MVYIKHKLFCTYYIHGFGHTTGFVYTTRWNGKPLNFDHGSTLSKREGLLLEVQLDPGIENNLLA